MNVWRGKSALFRIEHCFFRSASRNRNVFGRHAAGAGLLGSILFSSCSSRRGNSKCVPKLFFGERSWLLGGEAGRQTQHFRIFCSPNALFFWWMFSFSCELFRDFRKNNQIEFLRSLRGEKSSFLELLLKKEKKRRGISTFWVPFSDDLDPNF